MELINRAVFVKSIKYIFNLTISRTLVILRVSLVQKSAVSIPLTPTELY